MVKLTEKDYLLVYVAFAFGLLGNLAGNIVYAMRDGTFPTLFEWEILGGTLILLIIGWLAYQKAR